MQIITTRLGEDTYERWLGPILDAPPPEIWADAEHDMRRTAQMHPDKIWWIAIDDGRVLAWCAAWPGDGGEIVCGENYERRGPGRRLGAWQQVFAARQRWLRQQKRATVTWIFDQPVGVHLSAGWQRTGEQGVSEHGHHWQKLTWQPR